MLQEKYKQLYGRNPRKDWGDDKILEKILEKEPDFKVEEPEEEVIAATSDVIEKSKEEIVVKKEVAEKVLESVKQAEVIKEDKQPVSKGKGHTKQYRVILPDGDRYWTKNVIEQALKTEPYKSTMKFPEDTDYVASAELSKCKNC